MKTRIASASQDRQPHPVSAQKKLQRSIAKGPNMQALGLRIYPKASASGKEGKSPRGVGLGLGPKQGSSRQGRHTNLTGSESPLSVRSSKPSVYLRLKSAEDQSSQEIAPLSTKFSVSAEPKQWSHCQTALTAPNKRVQTSKSRETRQRELLPPTENIDLGPSFSLIDSRVALTCDADDTKKSATGNDE